MTSRAASSSKKEDDPLLEASKGTAEEKSFTPTTRFLDHFSLESPSDAVRFRSNAVRVYSSGTQQFQLIEEYTDDKKDKGTSTTTTKNVSIKAKVTSDGSSGLSLLRAGYTLVSVLMTGFLLIFCLQTLLFLFVSLVMEGGFTSKQRLNFFHFLGTILSIPLFVYGLASALTMASEFVHDTWNGHLFFRTILRWNAVYIDWIAFAAFLGIPLLVMLYRMFTNDYWWEATALTWLGCVTAAYAFFCLAVFVFEIWGALELLSHHPNYGLVELSCKSTAEFFKRAILLRQHHRYAGVRHRTFYIEGSQDLPTPNDSYDQSELADHEHVQEKVSWYCKMTQRMPPVWFTQFDTPVRQFHVEDVLDRTIFVTDATWNLEKLFCRRAKSRSVLVVHGSSRVTDPQVLSSFICAILGNTLLVVTFIALLWWADASFLTVVVLTALLLVWNRDAFRRIYVVWDTYQDTRRRAVAEAGSSSGSQAIYQVTETHRVTEPTEKLCWILFVLEIFGLFVFPLWMLFDVGNKSIALLFLVLGSFSAFRHYFNTPVVLSELGSLDLLEGQFLRTRNDETAPDVDEEEEDWREKNRLSKIVGKISQGSRRETWTGVITAFVVIFLLLFLLAFGQGSNSGDVSDASNLLHDFRYIPQEGTFKYPTCAMTSDFQIPGSNSTAMADYAYMASIAYTAPESMPKILDAWFGEGVAYDNADLVTKYRTQEADFESAVHYKLIEFPDSPDFAVLTIRGTSNGWDMISDAQLWSASFLAQMVRAILPVGEIWNPILENLVEMIGVLQSASLKKVSFYVKTSNFVEWLRSKEMYSSLRVTGHSLGGGLAMITGAQTKTPAIGLSGPNTIITRKTLYPPVTVESLDKYTFNIVPERDVVPMIDDFAKNIQKINCLAASNNFVDCHTSVRSLCEIQYTCGSAPRPTLCDCALYYGYPEPEATGDRTFAEACKK